MTDDLAGQRIKLWCVGCASAAHLAGVPTAVFTFEQLVAFTDYMKDIAAGRKLSRAKLRDVAQADFVDDYYTIDAIYTITITMSLVMGGDTWHNLRRLIVDEGRIWVSI